MSASGATPKFLLVRKADAGAIACIGLALLPLGLLRLRLAR
jgi:hypothetical protein